MTSSAACWRQSDAYWQTDTAGLIRNFRKLLPFLLGEPYGRTLPEVFAGVCAAESIAALVAASEVGVGSRFSVTLSRAAGRAANPATARSEAAQWLATQANHRSDFVLYVEDDPLNEMLMRTLIESRLGYGYATAATAQGGLLTARERRPALMLVDLNLPDLSITLRSLAGRGPRRRACVCQWSRPRSKLRPWRRTPSRPASSCCKVIRSAAA